ASFSQQQDWWSGAFHISRHWRRWPVQWPNDFCLGYAFIQRFYVAYDYTNFRVGFATTQFTHATTN
ncbi:hypothetical protein BDR07DRAFT_1515588, partial [Suillus spraguei]